MEFRRETFRIEILDPSKGFEPREVWFEVRWDPLTGETSRIFEDFGKPFEADPRELFKGGIEGFCPFCPGNLEKVTPKFPPSFLKEGRLSRGDVWVFPNLRPYDQVSAVVVLGKEHFVPLGELNLEAVLDGLILARDFFRRANPRVPSLNYLSINWNFLPTSGGSIVHPHFHAVGGPHPSNYLRKVEGGCRRYLEAEGRSFFEDLVREEKRSGERFLGEVDGIPWFLAFAPKGPSEVLFVLPGMENFMDVEEDTLGALTRGLGCLLSYWRDHGVYSFNLVIYGGTKAPKGAFWVHGRAVVRRVLNPWSTSDMHAFPVLQEQPVVGVPPEALAKEMRPYFRGEDVSTSSAQKAR